jgi:hypothetical protein
MNIDSAFIDQYLSACSFPGSTPKWFKRDQFGVVWYATKEGGGGFMSSSAYEELRKLNDSLLPVDQLPPFDNRQQNIVAVD